MRSIRTFENKNNRARLLALGMVAMMLMVGLAAIMPAGADELDAAVGDGGSYTYVLTYDSSQMSAQWDVSTALSVADMDAIYHPSYDGTTTTGYGSWTWNATTGVGPFNSFYAAFDLNNSNAFVAVLDPFDLTHGIDGTDYTSQLADLNIMWILPTVYWKTDATHLYLTDDPGNDTDYKAYAHTISGHTYKYLGIGVYDGSTKTIGSATVLTSVSGASPSTGNSSSLRYWASGNTMSSDLSTDPQNPALSRLWNFYQWELYKYCSYALTENFNTQNTVGNGNVYSGSGTILQSGTMNDLGPYCGNANLITNTTTATSYGTTGVKLFIENPWGNIYQLVDGVIISGTSGYYVNVDSPSDSTSGGTLISATIFPSSSFGSDIYTDAKLWGIASAVGGSVTTGLCDDITNSPSPSGNRMLYVGGARAGNDTVTKFYGIASMDQYQTSSYSSNTSRLAFLMDAVLPTKTVTLTTDGSGYGSLDGTTSFTVDPGSTITISGDTVTIGTDTVTAEPLSNTAQYTYDFVNWTIDDVAVTGSYTVDADTTIVANFSRTTNTYAVTITAGEGGSVSDASLANVPYGTTWSTSGDTLTIGTDTVTATPNAATAQYTYAVDAWSPASGTVEGATAISVSFTATLNSYTITYIVNDVPTEEVLDYGETPDPEDPAAPEGYRFYRWDPAIVPVTGNATYTAVFVEEGATVIVLDPNGGSVSVGQIYATQGQPVGELPTPTRMGFDFDGWFTAAEGGVEVTADTIVTEDMTIYAQWEITSTWNTYKILVYAMITLLFVGIAIAILRNYVGGNGGY